MPAIPANSHILVTGASGFIAIHTIDIALKRGFKVTGTVRTAEKGEYIKKQFPGKPFDYVIVKDIADPHAFDGVVEKGQFAGILHTASPFHLKADDPKELFDPAINGTVGILKSAKAAGDSVKRVVITSSVASIIDLSLSPPKTFTEEDWNTYSPKVVEEKGKDADPGNKYQASKVLAEQAAWKFVKESSPSFDLATILPSFVFGPILHEVPTVDQLNTSVAIVYNTAKSGVKAEDLPGMTGSWVDVRDVAEAHVEALLQEKAGGNRFITSNSRWSIQTLVELLKELDPTLNLPQTDKKVGEEAISPAQAYVLEGSKVTRELGLKYISLEQSIKDTYNSLKEYEAKVWKN